MQVRVETVTGRRPRPGNARPARELILLYGRTGQTAGGLRTGARPGV